MKKILFSCLGLLMGMNLAFAGGLVHNTNQSAAWARMLVRDASTSIDAAYYNPAGLTKLSEGLHLSVSNQSIFQKRTISNSLFPNQEWEGSVSAPFFPNLYAAYKTGNLVFSLGFVPIGGGGSAKFDNGVPMIELMISSLPGEFSALLANGGYSYTSNFEGSSVYFGIQGGVSYAVNDMVSLYVGGRYVMAQNSYSGAINNIALTSDNPSMPTLDYATLSTAGTSYQTGGDGMQPIIDGGGGSLTFAQAEGATIIDATTRAQLEGGLLALGIPQAQIDGMDIATAQATYYATATDLLTGAAYLADKELDVKQKGNGFTPIVGANIALMDDKLNIGLKYEFKTNMEVENETASDVVTGLDNSGNPVTMYPDGEKTNADIPAMLSIGASYKITDDLSAQLGYHYYFDKQTGWSEYSNPNEYNKIDNNYWELGLGFEYTVTDQILVSAGYLRAQTGVNDYYHDDLSYSLSSNTFGLGGAYKINDMLTLQVGGYYTKYIDGTIEDPYGRGFSQTYTKNNLAFAIGLDLTFGGGSATGE